MPTKETEFALLKADVKWTKKKVSEINTMQKMMAEDLSKLSSVLLKDEQTGFIGYISITRDLAKRVNKLETVKKAILGALFIGFLIVGWFLKTIWNYIISK